METSSRFFFFFYIRLEVLLERPKPTMLMSDTVQTGAALLVVLPSAAQHRKYFSFNICNLKIWAYKDDF